MIYICDNSTAGSWEMSWGLENQVAVGDKFLQTGKFIGRMGSMSITEFK